MKQNKIISDLSNKVIKCSDDLIGSLKCGFEVKEDNKYDETFYEYYELDFNQNEAKIILDFISKTWPKAKVVKEYNSIRKDIID